jgi:hypothetical protein
MRPRLYAVIISVMLMVMANISSSIRAEIRFNTIALSGSTGVAVNYGPNLGSGVTFSASGFSSPSISENGTVAFEGSLFGSGITGSNNDGLWSSQFGSLSLIAREGSASPTGTFGAIGSLQQNAANQVLFYDVASNSRWSNASGSLNRVDQIGTDGPLGPNMGTGVSFSSYGNTVFNNGKLAAVATITGTNVTGSNNRGLWINENGTSSLIARTGTDGSLGPNLGTGVRLSSFGQSHAMNATGKASFSGFVNGTGVNTSNDEAIWTNSANGIVPVAREGAEGLLGPNMGPGITLKSAGPAFSLDHTINSHNTIVFRGSAFDTATSLTTLGIWMNNGAGNNPAILTLTDGSLGPNMGPGTNFKFLTAFHLNSNDEILFGGAISGFGISLSDSEGIWAKKSNGINLVARTGMDGLLGPQLGAGIVFSDLFPLGFNNAGESLISGVLTGPGVDSTNDRGIWATDHGNIVKILRIGDQFDVDPTAAIELRTISAYSIEQIGNSNGEDGSSFIFNSNSMVTFGLTFTDGSRGIFTAVVPEPSVVALLVLSLFGYIVFARLNVVK